MSEIIEFEVLMKKSKWALFKGKVKQKFQDTKEFVVRHKDEIICLTPVAIGGLTTITKVVGKRVNLAKEKELHDEYCYDRSLGHYWRLKRSLSNKEWLEIDSRKKKGERLADILADMRVLK